MNTSPVVYRWDQPDSARARMRKNPGSKGDGIRALHGSVPRRCIPPVVTLPAAASVHAAPISALHARPSPATQGSA